MLEIKLILWTIEDGKGVIGESLRNSGAQEKWVDLDASAEFSC
jgi:hypothetical protein